MSSLDSLAVTKADVLNGMSEVPVVVAYEIEGQRVEEFPNRVEDLEKVRPITEQWPGWQSANETELQPFLKNLSREMGVPVSIVSNGRRRDEVLLYEPFAQLMEPRA